MKCGKENKTQEIHRVWWLRPGIPTTQKAEVKGSKFKTTQSKAERCCFKVSKKGGWDVPQWHSACLTSIRTWVLGKQTSEETGLSLDPGSQTDT